VLAVESVSDAGKELIHNVINCGMELSDRHKNICNKCNLSGQMYNFDLDIYLKVNCP